VTVRWRYLDASGESCGVSREFDTRGEAEAWLGESWSNVAAAGIQEVELVDGDRVVYRMGLREA